MVSAEPRNGQGDSAKWNIFPGFSTSCRDCISPLLRGASTFKGAFNSPHNASDSVSTQAMSADSRAKRSSSKPSAYRKSSTSILVMQSTQDRTAQNAPRGLLGT
jgi:hypothetical protein